MSKYTWVFLACIACVTACGDSTTELEDTANWRINSVP